MVSHMRASGPRTFGIFARWACLLGTCLLVLAGCMPQVAPTPEPVVVTFAFPPFDADRKVYEALAEAFNERYPHITVELEQWAYWQGFNAAEADVVTVFRDLLWLLRDQESIMALDAFIQQDASFGFDSEMRIFDRAIDQILSGEATPEEVMDWAQSLAQK